MNSIVCIQNNELFTYLITVLLTVSVSTQHGYTMKNMNMHNINNSFCTSFDVGLCSFHAYKMMPKNVNSFSKII